MPRGKAEQAEVIIPKLREVEVELGRGKTVAEAVKKIGVIAPAACRISPIRRSRTVATLLGPGCERETRRARPGT